MGNSSSSKEEETKTVVPESGEGYEKCSFHWADPEKAMEIAEWSGDVYPPTESDIKSKIKIPEDASTLSREELIDRIKGTIYGQAIGDAIGLATEFMSKKAALKNYPNKEFGYQMFLRDGHRKRWREGDWTDDTDQMLLILDGLLKNGGELDEFDFAVRIKYWMKHGFPPLGDLGGCGIGQTVMKVITHPDYLKDPHGCAKYVWEFNNKRIAPNGAAMRTGILGIVDFYDIEKVISNTKKISYCTHYDPRCTASCVAITTAIALILKNGLVDGVDEIVKKSYEIAKKELDNEGGNAERTEVSPFEEFDRHAYAKSLDELKLDDEQTMGYTYKCFGSAFYCFRNGDDFKKSITELILEGGDADTNAAAAGALLGCKFGYNALPKDWLDNLRFKTWLDAKVDRFLEMLGLDVKDEEHVL